MVDNIYKLCLIIYERQSPEYTSNDGNLHMR